MAQQTVHLRSFLPCTLPEFFFGQKADRRDTVIVSAIGLSRGSYTSIVHPAPPHAVHTLPIPLPHPLLHWSQHSTSALKSHT
ncbi:hypothetical protein E2C01_024888 [Portunus trituberculatus]|uniref:Uncharacterized protein n=1 Tax=Portunus trituberculatus TaxID=210409 RepID=A0A5B7EF29_PORTR|nr:hypothetical protein [Portunus trituberculatus]